MNLEPLDPAHLPPFEEAARTHMARAMARHVHDLHVRAGVRTARTPFLPDGSPIPEWVLQAYPSEHSHIDPKTARRRAANKRARAARRRNR